MTLTPTDTVHLDCVRGGGCCHAAVAVTPWEIAVLARALGLTPAALRDAHTVDGATRLRRSGAPDAQGRGGCDLLGAEGCTAHAARPLACRLFPLGRKLVDGQPAYHQPAHGHRCAALCPSYAERAPRRVSDWLREQQVAPGEVAHDAYGRLACGLLGQAAELARGGEAAAVVAAVAARAALLPGARAALLPRPWFDLLTAPPLFALIDAPERFVLAHAERILGAVAGGFAGEAPTAAVLVATLGLQLGESVGIAPAAAAAHVAAGCPVAA